MVHTHNTKPMLYAGPAGRLAGVGGIVCTRHGQQHGARRRQKLMFQLAARCADRIVCVSDDGARRCGRQGMNPTRVCTIRNGIDRERFAPNRPHAEGHAVFVGRLAPEKDIATLLRATAIVVTRRPSFQLLIAGTGPCAAELAKMSAELGLSDHVQFLGEVSDIPALLRGASLLVLPSLTEGLPLTVLEAMACGLPVVATRVGGTPEAVADGCTGLLVPPGDPEQLADALVRLDGDSQLSRQMGYAGHLRVERLFDVHRMVAQYESLYLDVLPSKRKRTG
jgi:glycosyltransferase involved in cell wall biosynthesis